MVHGVQPEPVVPKLDVVVVSYNSASQLRACVEPLSALEGVNVVVVDNASADASAAVVSDLPVDVVELAANGGFAHGCNVGWRRGDAPYVLFLNPDARIDEPSLRLLASVLDGDSEAAIAAPRIVAPDGRLHHSLRRFPTVRSTFAQALFLHRLWPTAAWADEIVRAPESYERPGKVDWASGASLLVRRSVLEQLDGWDEGFFLYCEDMDLCRRSWRAGWSVRFEPRAVAVHEGGASSASSATLPHLAASRVRYAYLHRSRRAAVAERVGVALESLTRLLLGRGGAGARLGHARAMRVALSGLMPWTAGTK